MTRGVAALLVIWWHTGGYKVEHAQWSMLYFPGTLAVHIFFILSGYLVSFGFFEGRYGLDRKGLLAFYRNRILRIYPLFVVVSATAAVLGWFQGTVPHVTAGFIWRQLLMMQWWHQYDLVGVFWTLGVEMQFYLIVPVLFAVHAQSKRPLLRGIGIYIALLAWPAFVHTVFGAWWDNRTLLGNLAHFQAGLLVNYLRRPVQRVASQVPVPGLAAALVVALALLVYATNLYHHDLVMFWAGKAAVAIDAAGIIILGLHCIVEERHVPQSPVTGLLAIVGVLSYGLYAWHAVVLTFVPSIAFRFFETTIASTALAMVTYYVVERPCLSLKVRRAAPVSATLALATGQ